MKVNKCIGCGLCETLFQNNAKMRISEDGFYRPYFKYAYETDLLEKICPLCFNSEDYSSNIWGKRENVYLGYANTSSIREKSSSGGIITQALVYLLEHKIIDAVIHIGASNENPLENNIFISESEEQVVKNSGSRYSPSMPLQKIDILLKENKKYAFVGKPCDIRALRNYSKINPLINERIIYTFSFFCMGTPSYLGTENLLSKLGVDKGKVVEIRYRGNGWPGKATVKDNENHMFAMDYSKSWGVLTGKFIQPYCRWCADGLGEFADIACGDAWYLDEEKKPIFKEEKGRNVIFARNCKGDHLLKQMYKEGEITLKDFEKEIGLLKYMNYSQYHRKTTMCAKILGLKVLKRDKPYYRIEDLRKWSKKTSVFKNLRAFIGTITRGLKGRI